MWGGGVQGRGNGGGGNGYTLKRDNLVHFCCASLVSLGLLQKERTSFQG